MAVDLVQRHMALLNWDTLKIFFWGGGIDFPVAPKSLDPTFPMMQIGWVNNTDLGIWSVKPNQDNPDDITMRSSGFSPIL